ncbi:unnamed protein product [Sphenostylis stenocarpa]|uniref:Myeloid leukemia factor 1 n=1 Tax=Sphenostylis stenocarpa TaxID=92480 RepID=A0AA86SB35_9FABA|nr:unnamed protein product [Sphenostylis stenocarpa]
MQKRREVQDDIFEPRGFGDFGGFRLHGRMMPSLFGGRDPFDDPFFSDPFDSLLGPNSASTAMQKPNRGKGIVIEELDSDDEETDNCPQHGDKDFDKKNSKSTMEPSVEHPDDDFSGMFSFFFFLMKFWVFPLTQLAVSYLVLPLERKNSDVKYKNDHYMAEPSKARTFSFQSSRVTYGGIDGAYYTSTRTRRMGDNGVVMEENKEADTTTGQAKHRISRGIHDKGHSVLRKLDSDGKVDTTQTLHNLNEDELAGFEEAWKGNNMAQLPGFDAHKNMDSSGGKQNRKQVWPQARLEPARRERGFPSNYEEGNNSGGRTKKVVRINIQ